MPILELCAGYGGLGMAVEALTGHKIAYVAEVDKGASAVLAHRFPNAPNIGDITTYNWSQLEGLVDIITAGFPCQDISNAGKREGISGGRSKIWKNVAESIRILRPRLVFLENVSAIRGRGLWRVLADLSQIGYDTRWVCIRASDVGASHPRDRWFLLARPAEDSDSSAWSEWFCTASRKTQGGGHGPTLDDEASFLLPYSDEIRRNGRAGNQREEERGDEPADSSHSPSWWWGSYLAAVRRWEVILGRSAPAPTKLGPRGGISLSADFEEWLMGLPVGHVCAVPGLSESDKKKALGNGVVPHQAYEAYKWLSQAMEDTS